MNAPEIKTFLIVFKVGAVCQVRARGFKLSSDGHYKFWMTLTPDPRKDVPVASVLARRVDLIADSSCVQGEVALTTVHNDKLHQKLRKLPTPELELLPSNTESQFDPVVTYLQKR